MAKSTNSVRQVDVTKSEGYIYERQYVGCLVLTQTHQIILQQRGDTWNNYPGYLAEYGGRIEPNERPIEALVRELHEELGAVVKESDVISLGALTEESSNHTELVYVYFWHDKGDTITGCYEGEARYFENAADVLTHPKVTDGLQWLLEECQRRRLLKRS